MREIGSLVKNGRVLTVLLIAYLLKIGHSDDCIPRKFDENSIVCVCNSTYCDSIDVEFPESGKFRSYTSSKTGQRLATTVGNFENSINNGITLLLNKNETYQTIHGFGGAFTDSAGLNIKSLSEATQEQLMQAYFGRSGNRYNFGRVPVGGTDFSTRPYTLDDVPGDIKLSSFSLAHEDVEYKIPYMKRALELNPELRFIAAAWTAPPWMKTNDDYLGYLGLLKYEYYQDYADYTVKFLEAYKNEGLPIWAISTGNEPLTSINLIVRINSMGWTPGTVAQWLINNLGPSVKKSNSSDTKILLLDDQIFELPWWIDDMYMYSSEVDKYADGIAYHFYFERTTLPIVLDITHERYPDKFLIMTEGCISSHRRKPVRLGDWDLADRYITSIIRDLTHWATGWVDWNLALDSSGGPTWANNTVDAPIIVNPETDEFFKQPIYYALAHVSKFVPQNSTRVYLSPHLFIHSVAFVTPNDEVVIVLHNPTRGDCNVTVVDPDLGAINIEMPSHSMSTIIYKQ